VAKELPREHGDLGEPVDGPWTPEEAAILGRFFDGGRLVQIPQAAAKRRLVVEKIALSFEPGRRYPERDVNFAIQLIHPDYAAIRRYMIEEGFMDRADGAYWRTGGRYDAPVAITAVLDDGGFIPTSLSGVDLRPYTVGMTAELVRAADHPEISRFMTDRFPSPYTMADAEAWVEFAEGSHPPINYAIHLDGVLIGGVGGTEGTGETTGTCEIGWWLTPEWWGRGITTAAASALVDELFEHRGFMRLFAPVMHPNLASARVAEKIGMRLEGRGVSHYLKGGVRYDQLTYGLTRRDWLAGR
jgi:RimJ/RimL family protein N-acetyltransferase